MKRTISLGDFIRQVKDELVAAQDKTGNPFYELERVQLEVSFALETTGEGRGRLWVVELGGKATASKTHKVVLELKPLPTKGRTQRSYRGRSPKIKAVARPSYKRK